MSDEWSNALRVKSTSGLGAVNPLKVIMGASSFCCGVATSFALGC